MPLSKAQHAERKAKKEEQSYKAKLKEYEAACMAYADGVESGEIAACTKLKLAVKRFRRELERKDLDWRPEVGAMFCYIMENIANPKKRDENIVLINWQVFATMCLLSFWHTGSDNLKYSECWLNCGRKAGKTTFVALLIVCFLLTQYACSAVVGATTLEQARITWDKVSKMLQANHQGYKPQDKDSKEAAKKKSNVLTEMFPFYDIQTKHRTIEMIQDKEHSDYRYCNAIPTTEDKSDGRDELIIVIDEVHSIESPRFINKLRGSSIVQKNPLLFMTTTAAPTKNCVGYEEYQLFSEALTADYIPKYEGWNKNGESDLDHLFTLIFEIEEGDDWADAGCWAKANPSLEAFPEQYGALLKLRSGAQTDMVKRREFLTDYVNRWGGTIGNHWDMEKWDALKHTYTPKTFSERADFGEFKFLVGLDYAELHCLAGMTLCGHNEKTGDIYLWNHAFLPADTVQDGKPNYKEYQSAIKRGELTAVSSPTVKPEHIIGKLKEWGEYIPIKEVAADRYKAALIKEAVEEEGYKFNRIIGSMRNRSLSLSIITGYFLEGIIHPDDNELFMFCLSNLVIQEDRNDNRWLDKPRSADVIDLWDSMVASLQEIMSFEFVKDGSQYTKNTPIDISDEELKQLQKAEKPLAERSKDDGDEYDDWD